MLKKIRFFCGKRAALHQFRGSKLKNKSNLNEIMGSGHDLEDEIITLSAFVIVRLHLFFVVVFWFLVFWIGSFIYTNFIPFHD